MPKRSRVRRVSSDTPFPETSCPVLGVPFLSFAFLALESSFLDSLSLDLPFLLESSVTLPFGGLVDHTTWTFIVTNTDDKTCNLCTFYYLSVTSYPYAYTMNIQPRGYFS